jgi:hypothetical protein
MTANIVLSLVFDPGARMIRTGFFQSRLDFCGIWRQSAPGPKALSPQAVLMALQGGGVKEMRRFQANLAVSGRGWACGPVLSWAYREMRRWRPMLATEISFKLQGGMLAALVGRILDSAKAASDPSCRSSHP